MKLLLNKGDIDLVSFKRNTFSFSRKSCITDVAIIRGKSVTIYPGDGNRSFGSGITTALQQSYNALIGADFNRDGVCDLAITGTNGTLVLFGKGDGTFTNAYEFPTVRGRLITAGDFNHDGLVDLAVVSSTSDPDMVLLGTTNGVPVLGPMMNISIRTNT